MQINIAPCGLVCSRCDAYRATKLNDPEKLELVAADWRKRYKCEDIKAERLPCDGCMTEGGRKSFYCGSICGIRQCALGKGVGVCSECRDYQSCDEIAGFLENNKSEQCKAMKKMLDSIAEVESKMHSAF
ncbi:MAG: DUF3795 domain-containing protein [Victivallaceae bacterium]|nr:DUF3795 domain-containing protein [Victivallaceae bacterium]